MSWALVKAVLDDQRYQRSAGGSLLVLVALAEWANKEGVCWPSTEQIAQRTRLKGRQVFYILAQLEREGILVIESGGGRGQRNHYRFALNGDSNPAVERRAKDQETVHSSAVLSEETLQRAALNPAVERRANKEISPRTTNNPYVEPDFKLCGEQESSHSDESAIEEVFQYYLKTMGKNPRLHTLTEKRKSMGLARFRECHQMAAEPRNENAAGMMRLCVDRLKGSSFHQGDNPQGKKYNSWEILFRSREQLVKWLDDDNFAPRQDVGRMASRGVTQ